MIEAIWGARIFLQSGHIMICEQFETDRLFVFGGAYGNLQATEAILNQARRDGYSPDQIIFTGDSVAYCGRPEETARLIMESGIHAVMGNCEESLGAGLDNCGCGFEEGSVCDALSAQWFSFCDRNISQEVREWMRTLPRFLTGKLGDFNLVSTHACLSSINRFVFQSDIEQARIRPDFPKEIDGIVVGHSGLPFVTDSDGHLWVNSGAAGMPANDGTPRVWYATLGLGRDGILTRLNALTYDHKAAADDMIQAGLDSGYTACLSTGLWPSLDVLPEPEKAASGLEIGETEFKWRKQFNHAAA